MKKLLLSLIVMLSIASISNAQRVAYVDTDYILSKIPAYAEAQTQLDKITDQWKAEIDKKYATIERKFKKYQSEQYLLDEQTKIQRQSEIENLEKAAKQFQKEKFGYEGELFEKRKELVAPIQDQVYQAVKQIASTKYDMVLDKAAGSPYMIYASDKLDKSNEVLNILGIN